MYIPVVQYMLNTKYSLYIKYFAHFLLISMLKTKPNHTTKDDYLLPYCLSF